MDLTSSLMEALSGTAKFKRIEQLKRWEESETNKECTQLKERSRKINFSDGCVFLAACAAGDRDEVERLIVKGADINTANVDGLTALHQSCIDDNLEMVEFLVENGADINCGDNEGWTPLHATASCGFLSIARYLIEHCANVAAVNNDGELPIDIAESDEMEELLQEEINKQEIDCETARNEEERRMLEDANQWLNSGTFLDRPHPKTGATALHVAAAKGYIKVMSALLQSGADLNFQDMDGWTALHAAAHWGQKEACEMLVEHGAETDIKNAVGQTAIDIAEPEMAKLLEEMRKKQASLAKDKTKSQTIIENKSMVVNRRMVAGCDKVQGHNLLIKEPSKEEVTDTKDEESSSESSESEERKAIEKNEVEKRNKVNKSEEPPVVKPQTVLSKPEENVRIRKPTPQSSTENEDNIPSWRRSARKSDSLTTTVNENHEIIPRSSVGQRSSVPLTTSNNQEEFKRPLSIEASERKREENLDTQKPPAVVEQTTTGDVIAGDSTPTTPSNQTGTPQRRSFQPPVRDEESETQRKAHAKRVRETRRSTQGVTLEVVKSAEQLVKQQQQEAEKSKDEPKSEPSLTSAERRRLPPKEEDTALTTTTGDLMERRSSWRSRLEQENHNKTEDTRAPRRPRELGDGINATTNDALRRTRLAGTTKDSDNSLISTCTVRVRASTNDGVATEHDKENENGSQNSTGSAAIQRRRRPKRRSTGVVYMDADDKESVEAKEDSKSADEENNVQVPERTYRSRFGSAGSLPDGSTRLDNSASRYSDRLSRTSSASSTTGLANDSDEKNYKKLYEDVKCENERLQEKLRKTEVELDDTKQQLDKTQNLNRNSSNDTEKRERRALERKISEMEEELKQLEQLRSDNQRLRDENGALIRVISKLSK
uniref:Protein phosphatase 1 regulatory subunit 12B n=1 Tax=Strigamia maritima TaxID=126957 RepID=T1JB99_STRMM